MVPIHTLNARSHIMLEVMRNYLGASAPQMKKQIQGMHQDLLTTLEDKKINYAELRSALVPDIKKREVLLIFDTTLIDTGAYGYEICNSLLPLLDPSTNHSILAGDLLGSNDNQQLICEILTESMTLIRPFTFKHSGLLFGIYINNLTGTAKEHLTQNLVSSPSYVGFISTTFMSRAKIYASSIMANFLLKKGDTFIMAHDDHEENSDNINITFCDVEKYGYKVASLQADTFGIFLSYKIERPVLGTDAIDTELALNSISNDVQLFDDFEIILDDAKHEYLINNKTGSLKKAGLDKKNRNQIERLIKEKVCENYIYNLAYLEEHDVMKFNVLIEINPLDNNEPVRLLVALEYLPRKKSLRVITLF